ncbi:hypothetical protein PC129_g23945 [Phytophthora cactorum]|uniref:RxLR effector protein n=1 Tax=Phytophthora cactorum TaxID=29920 RepID=A0A329RC18_9STRA|nr:hypothetical protein Pcac1_g20993 [Phytophthora cactorum]KAG2791478.1 hypothetical protein PC112_g24227 [Phytophthora cactorum]KAG2810175.1 hypothetical protein PC113_g23791 [Phytophthora cactorum]KAG2812899.1 hypothetical protein PC111_g14621 [Phytophthora cactorum]KAG2871732.1 hypothetical protein PC114_g26758 [Phytophthora cactorum]
MRLSYILPVVIAAILHASGSALPTAKESNQATLASPDIDDADGGKLLRGINKGAAEEDELEQEERTVSKKVGHYGKKFWNWFVWGKSREPTNKIKRDAQRWNDQQVRINGAIRKSEV